MIWYKQMCHLQSISSGHIVGFQGVKKVILKLQSPMRYRTIMSNISKVAFAYLQLLSESIVHSLEISLPFLLYSLTATLLDSLQTGGNALLLNTYTFAGCVLTLLLAVCLGHYTIL